MWFRILSAHWIFPLVTKIFIKDTWNQMQFPTALAVTQVNINLLPWKCLYWEKDTTRICGSMAHVQCGCWSLEDIPKVPSIQEWCHGRSAQLRAGHLLEPEFSWDCSRTNPGLVEAAHLITWSWRKDWIGSLWQDGIGVFSQAATDGQGKIALVCSRVGSGWIFRNISFP